MMKEKDKEIDFGAWWTCVFGLDTGSEVWEHYKEVALEQAVRNGVRHLPHPPEATLSTWVSLIEDEGELEKYVRTVTKTVWMEVGVGGVPKVWRRHATKAVDLIKKNIDDFS